MDTEQTPAAAKQSGPDPFVESALAKAKRKRRTILVLRVLLIAGILVSWELFSGPPGDARALIDEFYISKPSAMAEVIQRWVENGTLWPHLIATVQVTILGFVLGALLGMVLGFILGSNETVNAVFSPIVSALYAIPRLALIPLFLLWFGLGIGSKLALVVTVVFFLVFFNTLSGVRDVDRELINVLRVMKASRAQIARMVTIPSAMTWIIAGLRVSAPYALVGAVTGEMTASNSGMGYLIIRASGQFDTAGVFGGIFIIMVLALILGAFVNLMERVLLRWKSERGD